MKVIIATDNRFWREAMGSHRRIASLHRHLRSAGCDVRILFVGGLARDDRTLLARYTPSVEVISTAPDIGPSADGSCRVPSLVEKVISLSKRVFKHALHSIWTRTYLYLQVPMRPVVQTGIRWRLAITEPMLAEMRRPEAGAIFRTICQTWVPDAVIVEYIYLAYLVNGLRSALRDGTPLIIDTHDVMYERRARYHVNGEPHSFGITAREEAYELRKFDVILAIQGRDGDKLRALAPSSHVIVVPYPHPLRRLRRSSQEVIWLTFVGSLMEPNEHAARLLVQEIFPALRARLPGRIRLRIVGGVCDSLRTTALPVGVELSGFVKDLDAVYSSTTIVVNPVMFGGGLKIKNIEALCHGLPLVTTSAGAEGLEEGINSAFLVADDPVSFATAVAGLALDEARGAQLAARGYRFAEERFSDLAAYAEFDQVLGIGESNKQSRSNPTGVLR